MYFYYKDHSYTEPQVEFEKLKEEFEGEKAAGIVSAESIHDLGVKYGYLTGQWMLFAPWSKADHVWQTLVTSLRKGLLPDCVEALTCKPRAKHGIYANYVPKISISTPDFTKEDECKKVCFSDQK